jgi:hypothetical protein
MDLQDTAEIHAINTGIYIRAFILFIGVHHPAV